MSEIRLWDGHCDTAAALFHRCQQLADRPGPISLENAGGLRGYAQFFAFCTEEAGGEEPVLFSRMYEQFCAQVAQNAGRIRLCRSCQDAEQAAGHRRCHPREQRMVSGGLQSRYRLYERGISGF